MDKERGEKVLQWFKKLGVEEAAQTVTEHNEVDAKLLRQMVEKSKAAGEGLFAQSFDSSPPGFLFKKFSFFEVNAGNILHTERVRESERKLISSVRLCDTRVSLDTITVTTEALVDRDAFLSLLSVVSQLGFLSTPCLVGWDANAKEWRWEAPAWFLGKGYHTIAEFLVQWLEKMIWRRYFETNRIDPRKPADRSRPYKASTNTQLSTQAVLDPRKGRLKSFWHGLTDEEREKLSDVKVGQVMAKVVASEEKVDYMKMLKTLQQLTLDKSSKANCFDDKLRKDPVQFIEYLYLSSLDLAGKVREKVLRHVGDTIQSACSEKLAMDLINSEEQAKNKPPHHSNHDSVRFGKKKKASKRKKPLTSPSLPSPIKDKPRTVDLFVLNSDSDNGDNSAGGDLSGNSNNSSNAGNKSSANDGTNATTTSSSSHIDQISITRRKEKKKKKKKKQGGRGNGTMSASDAQQRSVQSSSPSSSRSRRHRHSLPEDFAQTHEAILAQIRAGTATPTDFEDEEIDETVSDGEIHDARDSATTLVGGEIVALSDEDLEEEIPVKQPEVEPVRPRREPKSSHDPPPPSPSLTSVAATPPPTTSNFKRSSSSNAISDIAKRDVEKPGSAGSSSGSGNGGYVSAGTGRRQRNASLGSYPTGSSNLASSASYSGKPNSTKTQSSPRGQQQQQHVTYSSSHNSSYTTAHTPHPHPRSLSVSAPTIHTPVTTQAHQQPYQQQRTTKFNTKQSLAIQALSLHESQQTPPHPRIRDIHAQTLAQSPKNQPAKPSSISSPASSPSSTPLKKSSMPSKLPSSYASAVAPSLVSSPSSPVPSAVSAAPTPNITSTTTSTPPAQTTFTTALPSTASRSTPNFSLPIPTSTHGPMHSTSVNTSHSQGPALSSSTPSSHIPVSASTHMSTSAPAVSTFPQSVFYKSLSSSALSDMLIPMWAGHYFPYQQYFSDLSLQLHHEMVDYVNYITAMAHTHQMMCQMTITRVAAVVTRLWPASRVEVFGSFASGLWMPSSDIDLVIVGVNYGARGQIGPQTTQFLLQILERELEKEPWVLSIQSIPNTRVPVMKLVSKEGNVPIDITFSETSTHHTGIASRNLVKQYVSSLPALAPLALVLKTFLRERGLNNTYTGGLSSYCLVLMIIAFLHHHYHTNPPLPPTSPATDSNNWGVLLLGFLSFYGKDFDYQRTGISIAPGRSTFPLPPPTSFTQSFPPHHHVHHAAISDAPEDTTYHISQPSYSHVHSFHTQHQDDTDVATTSDTSLQFPLEHNPPQNDIPTPTLTSFAATPHMYIEDPIRKGNNIGSHAFLMNRVQASFEFARNTLKDGPISAPSLLSRILNTRPCDIVPSSAANSYPTYSSNLPSVRSLPS